MAETTRTRAAETDPPAATSSKALRRRRQRARRAAARLRLAGELAEKEEKAKKHEKEGDMDDSWADEAPVAKAARREQASLWEARPGASAPAFKLGTRVVIHGLASMPEQTAHVVSLPTAE